MKNKIIKSEGYHPANIPTADVNQKQDEEAPNSERIIVRNNIVLYDANERPLIRKIGF